MFNIGPQELLLVLIVALIIVGPKRLPELGRTIGKGLNEFRKIQDEVKDMVKFDLGADPVDVEDPIMSTTPSFSDHQDADHEHEHDEGDARQDDEGDDGMTHSERVIAAMADDDDEPVAALPTPDSDDEPASPPDAPPAAAAE
jgi:sec-independent protein translocase protein TatA